MSISSFQRRLLGPIVPIIRAHGFVGDLVVSKVEKSLKNINPGRAQAIALLINSPGGIGGSCQMVVDTLRIYSKKHHLPLYTFAEDMALSGGYALLVAGDKVYADKTSWVGSIGAIMHGIDAKGLLRKYNIDVKTWKTTENMISPTMDPFADVDKEKTNPEIRKLSKMAHEQFINHVELYRDRKISVPKEQRREKVYNADIWTGKEALNLGLVDGLGTYQEVLAREFPDAKLVEVTKTSFVESLRERAVLGMELLDSSEALLNAAKKMK